ncbi:hypothetical protein [Ectobacillus ponti]|uniref:Uncharacterized protein n=1 Tax=Ectobacillus ponti TaxID=2961894 RepID=A0AA41X8I0_9BACI|nr:hypothetical protein [Ectobacillus ponti]MCP8970851.1 hypothetical protein [Ectobacillus ponti]
MENRSERRARKQAQKGAFRGKRLLRWGAIGAAAVGGAVAVFQLHVLGPQEQAAPKQVEAKPAAKSEGQAVHLTEAMVRTRLQEYAAAYVEALNAKDIHKLDNFLVKDSTFYNEVNDGIYRLNMASDHGSFRHFNLPFASFENGVLKTGPCTLERTINNGQKDVMPISPKTYQVTHDGKQIKFNVN